MSIIHLVEGPVGSGKSTFALELSKKHQAPRLILDDWMATLFKADRPQHGVVEWYMERKDRCVAQIWKSACEIVKANSDVILELGLIKRLDRERLYERVELQGVKLKIYVLDAPRELRRSRVKGRNKNKGLTYSMEVPDHIFDLASDMWEPIGKSECGSHEVEFIGTEAEYA